MWLRALILAGAFVVFLWALEIVDSAANNRLDEFGVRPRSDEGLLGILFAPVLHAGFEHLSANTVPALILAFLVLVTGIGRGLAATAIIWVVGGLGVWLVASSNSIHLGASVLIFGWLVYLILRGIFNRSIGEIALGVLVLLIYGGMLFGILPGQPGVSWQGHLFGAVGGAIAAFVLAEPRREAPTPVRLG